MSSESDDNGLDKTQSFRILTHGTVISHYKIIKKLGSGGMGVVYKAQDTKLKRIVALKFLTPQILGGEEEKARFVNEAQAAAALDHSNICTVHEIDEADGQTFIAMAYIDGPNLKEKIQAGPLKLDEALDIAIQIACGLQAAHEQGIVHRDIKSANIMLTEKGQAKIMDFGLAKLARGTQLTKTGTTMGTVAYMSPEQTRGKEVDHRTDIWSLGVVLYEMVTGQMPFKGDYEQAVMYSILNENPESLTSFRTDIPNYLEQVVSKALEKNQIRRYQNIQELLQDLKMSPVSSLTSPQQEKSIVVLPFVDISPSKDNEYFSDGLTEEIITDLSKIHTLRVISRTSAMRLKGTEKDVNRIGKELNVRYVLEGSVRKAGNDLRITAQLIDATTDSHLWAERYSGTLEDVFDIQEKVSRSIVDALKLKLSPEEDQRIAQRPIDNVHAYECYLRARQEIFRFTEDALERALQYLQNGLDIVGENALLYAGMGYVYWQYVNSGIEVKEEYLQKAEEYAKKVFELEPESSHGHLLLGLLQLIRGNPQQSVSHLKRALAIDPNDPDALFWLSLVYGYAGKTLVAVPLVESLLRIDPLAPFSHFRTGLLHLMEGRFNLALEPCHKGYQMDPENPACRTVYAWILAYNQRLKEAYSLFDQNVKETPQHFFTRLGLFFKYALQGKKTEALQSVTPELQITGRRDLEYSWIIATCYALLDEKEKSLDWLENAVNRGFINYPFLSEYDLFLENIRGEERFKQLMERVKYEWEHFEV